MKDVLIKDEAAEHGKTTVKGDRLGNSQTAQTEREGHRSQRAQSDNGDASEEGTTHVEILVISGEAGHSVYLEGCA